MKKLILIASVAMALMLQFSSCSGQAGGEANGADSDNGSQTWAVNESTLDEIYTQISDLVNSGDDLDEDEDLEDAIKLYCRYWKAYVPTASEIIKNGGELVDVYIVQYDNHPQVMVLLNKRIFPAAAKRKNRKVFEGKIHDNQKEFEDAIGTTKK